MERGSKGWLPCPFGYCNLVRKSVINQRITGINGKKLNCGRWKKHATGESRLLDLICVVRARSWMANLSLQDAEERPEYSIQRENIEQMFCCERKHGNSSNWVKGNLAGEQKVRRLWIRWSWEDTRARNGNMLDRNKNGCKETI